MLRSYGEPNTGKLYIHKNMCSTYTVLAISTHTIELQYIEALHVFYALAYKLEIILHNYD